MRRRKSHAKHKARALRKKADAAAKRQEQAG